MSTSASVLLNRLQAKARLRHLQVLVKLGELRNLKRSAEALGLSQPAVTQLLADLERLVELPLFERHSRGVRITPAGAELLPIARRMLDALADGSESLTAMKRDSDSLVRIGAITGALAGLLVQAVPAFAKPHPSVVVNVRESDVDQWALQLARREIDIALCREPAAVPAGHVFRPLLQDGFVVACGSQHPLAGRRGVAWRTLMRETWLPSPVGTAAREAFDHLVEQTGAAPTLCRVITRVSSLTWALLSAERMLTLIPYGVVAQLVEAGQLATIETEHPLPFKPIGSVMPLQDAGTATQVFAEFLEAFALAQASIGGARRMRSDHASPPALSSIRSSPSTRPKGRS